MEKPVIGVCFLTVQNLHPLMIASFQTKGFQDHYIPIIHAKYPNRVVSSLKSYTIPQNQVIPTQWGSISLVRATLKLFQYALHKHPEIDYLILLSETHIPILPWDELWQQIRTEWMQGKGRINIHRGSVNRWYSLKKPSFIPIQHFWKHSQWISMTKYMAEWFLQTNHNYLNEYNTMIATDEHYFGNVMMKEQLPIANHFILWHTTFVRFLPGQNHPIEYHSISPQSIIQLKKQKYWFLRKVIPKTTLPIDFIHSILQIKTIHNKINLFKFNALEANSFKIINSLEANSLEANSLEANSLESNSLEANHIESNSLEANSLEANHIESNSMEANSLKIINSLESNSLEANHIESNSLEANSLESNSLEANHIESNSMEANHIESNSMEANSLEANSLEANSLEANHIESNSLKIINSLESNHIEANHIESNSLKIINSLESNSLEANSLKIINSLESNHIESNSMEANHIEANSLIKTSIPLKETQPIFQVKNNYFPIITLNDLQTYQSLLIRNKVINHIPKKIPPNVLRNDIPRTMRSKFIQYS